MGAFQPEPGALIGNADADGELTFTWNEVGQFWPYAEIDTRTSMSQYPAPTFECTATSINLSPGWNFVSTPKKLKDGHCTVQQVFGDIDTGERSIRLYDAFASSWGGTGMAPGDDVKPLDGIWIYSVGPDEVYLILNAYPRDVPPTKILGAGWNAIGFSDTTEASANSTLMSVEAQWAYVIGFDAANQQYEPSIINNDQGEGAHNEGGNMRPGKGYWIYMTDSKELAGIRPPVKSQ